jgi:hypothetical protein
MEHDGTPEKIGTQTEGAAMSPQQEWKIYKESEIALSRFFSRRIF